MAGGLDGVDHRPARTSPWQAPRRRSRPRPQRIPALRRLWFVAGPARRRDFLWACAVVLPLSAAGRRRRPRARRATRCEFAGDLFPGFRLTDRGLRPAVRRPGQGAGSILEIGAEPAQAPDAARPRTMPSRSNTRCDPVFEMGAGDQVVDIGAGGSVGYRRAASVGRPGPRIDGRTLAEFQRSRVAGQRRHSARLQIHPLTDEAAHLSDRARHARRRTARGSPGDLGVGPDALHIAPGLRGAAAFGQRVEVVGANGRTPAALFRGTAWPATAQSFTALLPRPLSHGPGSDAAQPAPWRIICARP
jgi:hypothetical protein